MIRRAERANRAARHTPAPTAASARDAHHSTGAAAVAHEKHKNRNLEKDFGEPHDLRTLFVPFAIETSGLMGPAAKSLILKLSSGIPDSSAQSRGATRGEGTQAPFLCGNAQEMRRKSCIEAIVSSVHRQNWHTHKIFLAKVSAGGCVARHEGHSRSL